MASRTKALPAMPGLPAQLETIELDPADLIRVSGHNTGEPYFGKLNANRFDDPNPDPDARYGTCYLGTSLAVAVAETVLHDLKPRNGSFHVDVATIESRYVVRFEGEPLVLANLTGASLKRIGGHAGLTGASSYTTTKKWSTALHGHADQVDGFLHMSRQERREGGRAVRACCGQTAHARGDTVACTR